MTAILRRQAHLDKNGVRAAVTVDEIGVGQEAMLIAGLQGERRDEPHAEARGQPCSGERGVLVLAQIRDQTLTGTGAPEAPGLNEFG
jgi:hypothetical protein